MAFYRKKPVVIEAIKYTGDNHQEIADFMCGEVNLAAGILGGPPKWIIPTLEGNMLANVGDWIIKGVSNEFYPCKPDIFEMTYEKVEA